MIKFLGISLFFGLAGFFCYLGVQRDDSDTFAMAGMTAFFALLLLLGATVFRKSIDTEENAREGMRVITQAVKRIFD